MKDSRIASDVDPARARSSWWRATWRRWLAALNGFLEKGYRQADIDTGC